MSKQKLNLKEFAAEHGLTLGRHCCYGVYGGTCISNTARWATPPA